MSGLFNWNCCSTAAADKSKYQWSDSDSSNSRKERKRKLKKTKKKKKKVEEEPLINSNMLSSSVNDLSSKKDLISKKKSKQSSINKQDVPPLDQRPESIPKIEEEKSQKITEE
jgi:hypothetical protein